MVYYYVPKRLIEVKEKIQKIHKKVGEPKAEELNGLQLKKLVYEIVGLDKADLESYSFILKKEELSLLSLYIPANSYDVRIDNLIEVLGCRWNDNLMRNLYQHWQNNFTSTENQKIFIFMENSPLEIGKRFQEEYSISPAQVLRGIKEGDSVERFSEAAAQYNADSLEEFKESLQQLGLNLNFQLAKECIREFYFVCSGSVYMKLGQRQLFNLIKTMKPEQSKRILINMLSKLSDQELDRFYEVLDFYYRRTGDYGRDEFVPYFKDVSPVLVRKYGTWLNRWNIKRIFLNDTKDRSKFWLQYADKAHVSYMRETDCLVFRFPKSIFIEFKEIGPVYQYEIQYYDSVVSNMVVRTSKDSELKRWLRNASNHQMLQEHRGYWQEKVAARIAASL